MEEKLRLNKIVGMNLKRIIRQSRYRTQEEFAYEYGYELRTVSRWLNGGLDSLETIEDVAEFLEVEPIVQVFEEPKQEKKLCVI